MILCRSRLLLSTFCFPISLAFCMSIFELDLIFLYSRVEMNVSCFYFDDFISLVFHDLFFFVSRFQRQNINFVFCLKYSFALSLI